jgi:hypothetical protein
MGVLRVHFMVASCVLLLFLGSAAPGQLSTPEPYLLETTLATAEFWNSPVADLVENTPLAGFEWLSVNHDAAQSTREGNTLFGVPVTKTVIRCEDGKPRETTVLFYNRGDSGEIGKQAFEALIRRCVEAITAATQVRFVPRGKDNSNAVKAEGIFWKTPSSTYLLEYSFTKEVKGTATAYRSEFVRLQITPAEEAKSLVQEKLEASKKPGSFNGQDHVLRDAATGDVSITDIPMVDQGEKGYCVVASAERVLRYYDIRADENELAQLANSSASGGTSVAAMTDVLKKLSARLKVKIRTLDQLDVRKIETLVAEYNRAAQRRKTQPIVLKGYVLDVQDIYLQMDTETLREARTKNRSALSAFERMVKANVDNGTPLLWSLMLGKVPEANVKPGSIGGHMRLIIGYNDTTKDILYSDSWGIGHDKKRMSSADAWTVTTGLAKIEPL